MAIIYTSKGQEILVSEQDYKSLNKLTWYVNKMGYAVNDSKPRKLMHRAILGFPSLNVDHVNRNKLDNRRENLRLCTQSGNTANTSKRKTNTSGHKGVSLDRRNPNNKWVVNITKDYKHIYGGAYTLKSDAVKRYKELAVSLHGEFTRT